MMNDSTSGDCRILICDDTRGIRMLLRTMLSAHSGVAVVGEAANGREAIDLARELRPDVVLLDISMPVMDGMEALPQILTVAPETAVLMLSGFSAPEIRQRAIAEGASIYLEKGIDFDEIIAAVRRHCRDGDTS